MGRGGGGCEGGGGGGGEGLKSGMGSGECEVSVFAGVVCEMTHTKDIYKGLTEQSLGQYCFLSYFTF